MTVPVCVTTGWECCFPLQLFFINSDFKRLLKKSDCQQLHTEQTTPSSEGNAQQTPRCNSLFYFNSIGFCHLKCCHWQKATQQTNKNPDNLAAFVLREWRGYIWRNTWVWHSGTGKSNSRERDVCLSCSCALLGRNVLLFQARRNMLNGIIVWATARACFKLLISFICQPVKVVCVGWVSNSSCCPMKKREKK